MLSPLPKKILSRISGHFLSPQSLLEEVGLRPGAKVLELGSPLGFFAPAALSLVGPDGSVYVAGPDNESLEALSGLGHHDNLHPVLLRDVVTGKAAPLHDMDIVVLTNFLSNTMHPGDFCISIDQYLGPQSEVLLVDWDSKVAEVGPSAEQRVSREAAIKLLASCGLEFVRVLKTPGYHYGLVFRASGQTAPESGNVEA